MVVKSEEIVGFIVGEQTLCCDCAKDFSPEKAEDVLVADEDSEDLTFCDSCRKRII